MTDEDDKEDEDDVEEEQDDDEVLIMEQDGAGSKGKSPLSPFSSSSSPPSASTIKSPHPSSSSSSVAVVPLSIQNKMMDIIPSTQRHERFVKKLAKASREEEEAEDEEGGEGGKEGGGGRGRMQALLAAPEVIAPVRGKSKTKSPSSSAAAADTAQRFTPLEQQVLALKRGHPDTMLLIECGYRFRFFGEDALQASKILGIYAYIDHAFYVASIPTLRIKVGSLVCYFLYGWMDGTSMYASN